MAAWKNIHYSKQYARWVPQFCNSLLHMRKATGISHMCACTHTHTHKHTHTCMRVRIHTHAHTHTQSFWKLAKYTQQDTHKNTSNLYALWYVAQLAAMKTTATDGCKARQHSPLLALKKSHPEIGSEGIDVETTVHTRGRYEEAGPAVLIQAAWWWAL